jgi:hypothetical protein
MEFLRTNHEGANLRALKPVAQRVLRQSSVALGQQGVRIAVCAGGLARGR